MCAGPGRGRSRETEVRVSKSVYGAGRIWQEPCTRNVETNEAAKSNELQPMVLPTHACYAGVIGATFH